MSEPARRPLRILHVSEAFGGGVFEIVKTLAERLATAGDTVAVAYGRRPETPAEVGDHVDPAVELMPLPWGERRSPHAPQPLTTTGRIRLGCCSLLRSPRPP